MQYQLVGIEYYSDSHLEEHPVIAALRHHRLEHSLEKKAGLFPLLHAHHRLHSRRRRMLPLKVEDCEFHDHFATPRDHAEPCLEANGGVVRLLELRALVGLTIQMECHQEERSSGFSVKVSRSQCEDFHF